MERNMAHKSNAELTEDNARLTEELTALKEQLSGVDLAAMRGQIQTLTAERDEAQQAVVALTEKLKDTPTSKSPTDGHNVNKQELRMLAAFCLPSTKDPSGRPHNEATIDVIAPQMVKVAVKLAEEIVSQIP
jgi:hypothetical protein